MHGSVEKTGAIKLLKEFRLHGFMIGLLVFILLWAWKSASSLAPGDENTERGLVGAGGMVSGEDAKSGFIRLLQRNIAKRDLIETCLATWKHSQITTIPEDKEKQIGDVTRLHKVNPRTNQTVSTYLKIADILKKR
jgi:hypothetical protein